MRPFVVGILRGEGSGPELIDAACNVLDAVAETCRLNLCIKTGGDIGSLSAKRTGEVLTDKVAEFCREVFSSGGGSIGRSAGGAGDQAGRRPVARSWPSSTLTSHARFG